MNSYPTVPVEREEIGVRRECQVLINQLRQQAHPQGYTDPRNSLAIRDNWHRDNNRSVSGLFANNKIPENYLFFKES
jgi:hypothetical protein